MVILGLIRSLVKDFLTFLGKLINLDSEIDCQSWDSIIQFSFEIGNNFHGVGNIYNVPDY